MNKYELAVVLSAKIEDEDRAAVIEKVKAQIERFGGTVTEVDEWVREDSLMRSRRCAKDFTTSFVLMRMRPARLR